LHNNNILHRDLKCSNIFLSNNNDVKLGDFGIAKSLENTLALAQTKVGTPYYMSPEVCRSEKYSTETDIWSLGCIIYELCTFRPPFDGKNLQSLAYAIMNKNADPIPFN